MIILGVLLDVVLPPALAMLSFRVLLSNDGSYRKDSMLRIIPLFGVLLAGYSIWQSVLATIDPKDAVVSMLRLVLCASYGVLFIRLMIGDEAGVLIKMIRWWALYLLCYIAVSIVMLVGLGTFDDMNLSLMANWSAVITYGCYVLMGGLMLLFIRAQERRILPEAGRPKPLLLKKWLAVGIGMAIVLPTSIAVVQQDIVQVNYATLAAPKGVLIGFDTYATSPYNPAFHGVSMERMYREKLLGPDIWFYLNEDTESYLLQSWFSLLSWGVVLAALALTDKLRRHGLKTGVIPLPFSLILWSLLFSSLYIHQLMYSLLHWVNGQVSILLAGLAIGIAYRKAKDTMDLHALSQPELESATSEIPADHTPAL